MFAKLLTATGLVLLLGLFFDPVTTLPFGIQPYVEQFFNTLDVAVQVLPPLETVLTVFLIGFGVKIGMFIIRLTYTVISFFT